MDVKENWLSKQPSYIQINSAFYNIHTYLYKTTYIGIDKQFFSTNKCNGG